MVDVDTCSLVRNKGKRLDIEEITLSGLQVFYEKSLRSSNVDALLQHLNEGSEPGPDGKAAME